MRAYRRANPCPMCTRLNDGRELCRIGPGTGRGLFRVNVIFPFNLISITAVSGSKE